MRNDEPRRSRQVSRQATLRTHVRRGVRGETRTPLLYPQLRGAPGHLARRPACEPVRWLAERGVDTWPGHPTASAADPGTGARHAVGSDGSAARPHRGSRSGSGTIRADGSPAPAIVEPTEHQAQAEVIRRRGERSSVTDRRATRSISAELPRTRIDGHDKDDERSLLVELGSEPVTLMWRMPGSGPTALQPWRLSLGEEAPPVAIVHERG